MQMNYQGNCCYDFVGRSCNEAMYDEFDLKYNELNEIDEEEGERRAMNTWHCCEEGIYLW